MSNLMFSQFFHVHYMWMWAVSLWPLFLLPVSFIVPLKSLRVGMVGILVRDLNLSNS